MCADFDYKYLFENLLLNSLDVAATSLALFPRPITGIVDTSADFIQGHSAVIFRIVLLPPTFPGVIAYLL